MVHFFQVLLPHSQFQQRGSWDDWASLCWSSWGSHHRGGSFHSRSWQGRYHSMCMYRFSGRNTCWCWGRYRRHSTFRGRHRRLSIQSRTPWQFRHWRWPLHTRTSHRPTFGHNHCACRWVRHFGYWRSSWWRSGRWWQRSWRWRSSWCLRGSIFRALMGSGNYSCLNCS